MLLAAGSASGSMDAANILKPTLARGAIRVIGATTIREYRQTIEKAGALERRFQAVKFEEPSADEAVAILLALRPRLEAHHGVALDEAALRSARIPTAWCCSMRSRKHILERAMDRLLGTLVAEALLSGKITEGQMIRLAAVNDRIQFCEGFSP